MKRSRLATYLPPVAWILSALVSVVAIVAWGQGANWHIFPINTLGLFPVFGLLAFSLLWSQYITLALSQVLPVKSGSLKRYYEVTGYLVLVAILLHPGLLAWQLWRDGGGLPPGSYLHYVLPSLKAFAILGMINLTILLLFELRRLYATRPWWRYMVYLVDIVIISVYVHASRLGTQITNGGWFRVIWLLYGATLAVSLVSIYYHRFSSPKA